MIARPKYEIGKILEHPVFFEHVKDRVEKIPGNSDDGLVRAASRFDAFVEVAHAGIVALGDECISHWRDAGDCALVPGGAFDTRAIVKLADARLYSRGGDEAATFHEFLDVDDVAQQSACPDFSNVLD